MKECPAHDNETGSNKILLQYIMSFLLILSNLH